MGETLTTGSRSALPEEASTTFATISSEMSRAPDLHKSAMAGELQPRDSLHRPPSGSAMELAGPSLVLWPCADALGAFVGVGGPTVQAPPTPVQPRPVAASGSAPPSSVAESTNRR